MNCISRDKSVIKPSVDKGLFIFLQRTEENTFQWNWCKGQDFLIKQKSRFRIIVLHFCLLMKNNLVKLELLP